MPSRPNALGGKPITKQASTKSRCFLGTHLSIEEVVRKCPATSSLPSSAMLTHAFVTLGVFCHRLTVDLQQLCDADRRDMPMAHEGKRDNLLSKNFCR